MTNLPKWLTDEFPEHDIVVPVTWNKDELFVIDYPDYDWPEGHTTYVTIEEAYDDAQARGFEVEIDESCNGHGGELHGGLWFSTHRSERGTSRLLFSGSSTRNSVSVLEDSYKYFLELTEEYDKDPFDFVTAYNWLDRHPAFWVRPKNEKTFNWETDYRISDAWVWVGRNDDGQMFVCLETGGHVEDDYTHRYHDMRLDVTGNSMEDAYIKLAAKVRYFFDLEGNSLDVEYEKSATEKRLESIIGDLDTEG